MSDHLFHNSAVQGRLTSGNDCSALHSSLDAARLSFVVLDCGMGAGELKLAAAAAAVY